MLNADSLYHNNKTLSSKYNHLKISYLVRYSISETASAFHFSNTVDKYKLYNKKLHFKYSYIMFETQRRISNR